MNRLFGLFAKDRQTATLATCLMIAAVVLFNIVIYTLTSAFGLYIYTREYTDLSISGNTDSIFAGLSEGHEVTITFCMDKDTLEKLGGDDTGSYVYKTVNQLRDRYDFIKVRYVNMLTKRDDETGEIFPFDKYKTDMRGNETPIGSNTVIFSSGENYRTISDTASFFAINGSGEPYAYLGEEIIASMIAWVLNDEHGVAYLTEKHGETADISLANMLNCAGYYIDTINLRKDEVPVDADLVVISNPTTDFYRLEEGSSGRSEIERLETYLADGGNLYVSIDPQVRELPVLEGFLSEWGIELMSYVSEDGIKSRAKIKDVAMGVSSDGYSFISGFADSDGGRKVHNAVSGVTDGRVLLASSAALKLNESMNVGALLTASGTASLVAGGKTVDNSGNYAVAAYAVRKNDNGTEGRVVVIPTIYITASDALVSDGYANRDFLYATFREIFGAKTMPIGCNISGYESNILENFTMKNARIFTAIILSVPVCLSALGAFIIIRRKNR